MPLVIVDDLMIEGNRINVMACGMAYEVHDIVVVARRA